MPRTLLITGGAGFIGSHLAEDALAGGWRVVALDDLSTGRRENLPAQIRLVVGDVAGGSDLVALLRDEGVTAVSHHAAQIDVRRSLADPVEDARVNVLGSVALFDACRRAGVRRVVFASSGGAIYGEAREIPTPETAAIEPTSPYGCAKRAAELYLEAMARTGELEPVVLRYANVYGPRQGLAGEAGVISIFARALLGGGPARIFGDGAQTRDFLYVGDVVAAHRAAIEGLPAGSYNVGTGVETSVAGLFARMAALAGVDRVPEHGAPVAGEVRRSALAAERLLRAAGLPGWTPLEAGLATTLAWFRSEAGSAKT